MRAPRPSARRRRSLRTTSVRDWGSKSPASLQGSSSRDPGLGECPSSLLATHARHGVMTTQQRSCRSKRARKELNLGLRPGRADDLPLTYTRGDGRHRQPPVHQSIALAMARHFRFHRLHTHGWGGDRWLTTTKNACGHRSSRAGASGAHDGRRAAASAGDRTRATRLRCRCRARARAPAGAARALRPRAADRGGGRDGEPPTTTASRSRRPGSPVGAPPSRSATRTLAAARATP